MTYVSLTILKLLSITIILPSFIADTSVKSESSNLELSPVKKSLTDICSLIMLHCPSILSTFVFFISLSTDLPINGWTIIAGIIPAIIIAIKILSFILLRILFIFMNNLEIIFDIFLFSSDINLTFTTL